MEKYNNEIQTLKKDKKDMIEEQGKTNKELNEFTKTFIKKSYDFKVVSSIYIPKIRQMKREIGSIKKDKNI